jgi:hypothetical protein
MGLRLTVPILILVLSTIQNGPSAEPKEQSDVRTALATPALEDSCSKWMKQEDGSYWRTCVDANGRQYCEVSKNGHVSRVKCSTT